MEKPAVEFQFTNHADAEFAARELMAAYKREQDLAAHARRNDCGELASKIEAKARILVYMASAINAIWVDPEIPF